MKKDKKRLKAVFANDAVTHDWRALFAALKDVIDWALDIAIKLSRYNPEDQEAIEKVRGFFHASLDGRPCDVPLTDILLTFGTILSAIEIDLGLVSPPANLPPVFRFPGARDGARSGVIRRCPGARIACGHGASLSFAA